MDIEGLGSADIPDVCRISGIKKENVVKLCRKSDLFVFFNKEKIYYQSQKKLFIKHKLFLLKQFRVEKLTKVFIKQLGSKKTFEGYICKCYMERDLNLDRKIRGRASKGRISYQRMADYFNISRKTAITNIKRSTAKKFRRRRCYNQVKLKRKEDLGNYLLNNMDKTIDGRKIEDNPKSYCVEERDGRFFLAQDLPNYYKFTALFQIYNRKKKRGKRKQPLHRQLPKV